jgi:hypothetical protein
MLDMLNMTNRMDLLMSEIGKPDQTPARLAFRAAGLTPHEAVTGATAYEATAAQVSYRVVGTIVDPVVSSRRTYRAYRLNEHGRIASPAGDGGEHKTRAAAYAQAEADLIEVLRDREEQAPATGDVIARYSRQGATLAIGPVGALRDELQWLDAGAPHERDGALGAAGWVRISAWVECRDDGGRSGDVAMVRRAEGNRFVPAAEAPARNSGTEYGHPAPMPLPESESTEGREPDAYGVALGDLVVGEDTVSHASRVGVVVAKVVHTPHAGMPYHRYVLRTGELREGTGDALTVTVYERPRVMAPAGKPVECAACLGQHTTAERFVECLLAHQRVAREVAAQHVAEAVSA